ncbi:phenylalanine ammonia lyase [Rhodotorula toruloides]|uniref:Phenylalanine ammonia lyase n=1 Tax=Rhodotorula toruloides TaxID=5286 RepID=A0A511KDW4_RHOTO|nr:phenylalanine ammonia lyase [Rhodotorula toruloides]
MPRSNPAYLPRLLSLLPRDGVGARIYPKRWVTKGLPVPSVPIGQPQPAHDDKNCYWEVKEVKLKTREDTGTLFARVKGVKYWKGKRVTPETREWEHIRGGLKWKWYSDVVPPLLARDRSSKAAAARPDAAKENAAAEA